MYLARPQEEYASRRQSALPVLGQSRVPSSQYLTKLATQKYTTNWVEASSGPGRNASDGKLIMRSVPELPVAMLPLASVLCDWHPIATNVYGHWYIHVLVTNGAWGEC